MAQKKKSAPRAPRASEPRMYGDGKPSQATNGATTASPAPASTTATQDGAPVRTAGTTPRTGTRPGTYGRVDKIVDYSYVRNDLRRLGITAAGILAILVVLGIIIP